MNILITFKQIQPLMTKWRKELLIDPHWTIKIRVITTKEAEEKSCLAETNFNAERWLAYMSFSEELTIDTIEGAIVHELLELLTHETYDILLALVEQYDTNIAIEAIIIMYKAARNHQIEKLVPIIRRSHATTTRPSRVPSSS